MRRAFGVVVYVLIFGPLVAITGALWIGSVALGRAKDRLHDFSHGMM